MALQSQDSARATNMVYTQIIFALFLDLVVFQNLPDFSAAAGIFLILGSVFYQIFIQKA
jgi:drug/metabolite transporter (DMT)-like permease